MIIGLTRSRVRSLLKSIEHQIFTRNFFQLIIFFFPKKNVRFFSIDLHTSVTRDIENFVRKSGGKFTRWSIAGTAKFFNDPNLRTSYVSNHSWRRINPEIIEKFHKRYQIFLSRQNIFCVSYTFSFVQLFEKTNKPILVVNAIRYESPFTLNETKFKALNKSLENLSKKGLLTVISNNLGDQDYLKQLSNIDSIYIPILCDYITPMKSINENWVVISRNKDFSRVIAKYGKNLVSQYDLYPNGYTFKEFSNNKGVVLIPQNISLMKLFELTTGGFPVRIPSDRLLLEWRNIPGVLTEISYLDILQENCPRWLKNTPADIKWDGYYPWWLSRADWCNKSLFPNVSRFDSLEELEQDLDIDLRAPINLRNEQVRSEWQNFTKEYLSRLT